MKNLLSVIVLAALAVVSTSSYAGSANASITRLSGTSQSITFAGGNSFRAEGAVGTRHLDSNTGGIISVRDEYYARGTVETGGYREVSVGAAVFTGVILEATRIGESYIVTVGGSTTTGFAWNNKNSGEVGVFTAYDQVDGSYSAEVGAYVDLQNDYSLTLYSSNVGYVRYDTSAYGIYHAN